MSFNVILDAGHGGSDPGAVSQNRLEKDYTLQIATKVRQYLDLQGVANTMTRVSDVDVSLNDRTNLENNGQYDLFVSIHLNSGGGVGTEVYYSIYEGTSKICAKNILNQITKLGFVDRGIKTKTGSNGRDYFHVIRETKCPSVLVETCFIDSNTDMQNLNTDTMAIAIAKGICETLGVEYKTQNDDNNIQGNTQKLYRVQVGAFSDRKNAEKLVQELKQKGMDAFIV